MKMYTENEIFDYLRRNSSSEPVENIYGYNIGDPLSGKLMYHVYIDECGNLYPCLDLCEEEFRAEYDGPTDEDYKFENRENPEFMSVVKELTEKVNKYIHDWMEETED